MNNTEHILGVEVDVVSKARVTQAITEMLRNDQFSYITTPNPEMIMRAQSDEGFRTALNGATLRISDGVGLQMAAELLHVHLSRISVVRIVQLMWVGFTLMFRRTFTYIPHRVSGVDVVYDLLEEFKTGEKTFFLLGGKGSSVQKAAQTIREKYPHIQIVGAESGGDISEDGVGSQDEETLAHINKVKPDILIVGFGAPKQEKWLYRNKNVISAGVGLGVGGTIAFIAGEQKRAPRWVQSLHGEWLWRLVQNPRRLKRIFTAFPLFPLYVAVKKFSMLQ